MKVGFALIVISCLLVGAVGGYGVGLITYEPKVRSYEAQTALLTLQVTGLETKAKSLELDLAQAKCAILNYEVQVVELQTRIASLQSRYEALLVRYQSLNASYNIEVSNLNTLIEGLRLNLSRAEAENSKLRMELERLKKPGLKDPTWLELKAFLEEDDTNKLIYRQDEFDCTGFAITLRDHAWKRGFRCAYVEVCFTEGGAHALNAFQTLDKGLIYVDVTGDKNGTGVDTIAYVEVGKPYGCIELKGVKEKYIACEGDPAAFWGPLTYATHPNPFSYDYYLNYQRRAQFYKSSVEAYNKAVEEYNKAVKEYNEGTSKYTYLQLKDWYERLEAWSKNLEALKRDLGDLHYGSLGVVKTIEVYWSSHP